MSERNVGDHVSISAMRINTAGSLHPSPLPVKTIKMHSPKRKTSRRPKRAKNLHLRGWNSTLPQASLAQETGLGNQQGWLVSVLRKGTALNSPVFFFTASDGVTGASSTLESMWSQPRQKSSPRPLRTAWSAMTWGPPQCDFTLSKTNLARIREIMEKLESSPSACQPGG